jgi:hypothetical protein
MIGHDLDGVETGDPRASGCGSKRADYALDLDSRRDSKVAYDLERVRADDQAELISSVRGTLVRITPRRCGAIHSARL